MSDVQQMRNFAGDSGYEAWLAYPAVPSGNQRDQYLQWCKYVEADTGNTTIRAALTEWKRGMQSMLGLGVLEGQESGAPRIILGTWNEGNPLITTVFDEETIRSTGPEGFAIRCSREHQCIAIGASAPVGVLYGVFHLLRLMGTLADLEELDEVIRPVNGLRMINHWDNFDGSIERGYAGRSFLYENNRFIDEPERLRDYARLMSSTGINGISINNVNVHQQETLFISKEYLSDVARIADQFRDYGIRLFLSVNFAAPMHGGDLDTADPLDPQVRQWWRAKAAELYEAIPDFGGFIVKADSENRPGPFTYGRNHADGANMLAEALEPFGGLVIWRCFVYNCKQDWRDRKTDRARAAYDHFKPLDGQFKDNVILQIKNGPMDFQVREPVSPLFGALEKTNHLIEFQITQEYTGQQRHLCYLVPQWKEILEFDTYAKGEGSPVKRVVDGSLWGNRCSGMAAVTNVGRDVNWTGHLLAQANLYGYGRLSWDPELSAEAIASEWTALTFGSNPDAARIVIAMLMDSWNIYESYTAPLGVGWMVNPEHHYGPNVDGYEYSQWGTYHFADHQGIGVDRTLNTGTGYSGQYMGLNAERYDSVESCPDELLLFFHHVPYTHVLHSGKTVIQHIYDTHFEGAEQAAELVNRWSSLKGRIADSLYDQVAERLKGQAVHAKEWRDQINTYFYRKSGIEDMQQRTIY
ncbi:alpha-glucuronidase family glycosyl hydrolase [Paenibacillus sp. JX-17]|uniref:Xylan alpha-1,2-glucuronidase n=1 Tax=Paenibacillus lacisoli TaxID=3064525 RepID=A0ABT9C9R3_9BACL|nr:alpha-glucuronidase family glycosyl hydrolase [Paenibacillus sp. JX-17]MDO7905318.1 alpha-glucuronidase family glycosyl hydrolase [Paenibacillus sp. JX-17]